MLVELDGSNLHDNSSYASEVVYGANVDQSSWRVGEERSTSVLDDDRQAYFRTEMSSVFGTTLPASGSGSHFNYGHISNASGNTKTITWTTARTIKAILISGSAPTAFFSGGYVQPYIGGNTTADLSSTQYTFLQATTSSTVNDRYYDFSA